MKILIDFSHPAHVHYFKHFIQIMQDKGHVFAFTARDKEITLKLVEKLGYKYISRGRGGKNILSKMFYIPIADFVLYKLARKFRPDIILSFSSPYAAHVSRMIGVPHIAFDDTEHAKFDLLTYTPFTDAILTPHCFWKNLGPKQIRFNGYMELCYLNKNYFSPDKEVLQRLKVREDEPYFILRFVSWSASHDIGQGGLTQDYKVKLINALSKRGKVFISSENPLPASFQKYLLPTEPDQLHSVLYYASLYIGEGSTTASECSILGTPSIYINSLSVGYCTEQDEKYGLCLHFKNQEGLLEKAIAIAEDPSYKTKFSDRKETMLRNMIDVTAFMVWFIENYPGSFQTMKENPETQFKFK